ncbi:MAG: hypothetical protein AVO35_11475 [Candidatus Aegiribacteria sp. MLS_C]|nr:MAG: hypothetical protein AVO35_11475 [Candidatus Aegiribacteria sp. MLS_C]
MRSYVFTAAVMLVLIAAGCNPVGMDDTRCYVLGRIFEDASHTTGAEDVGVFTMGTQESYTTMTNENGDFFIEIQLYPEVGTEQGGTSGSVTFGLQATYTGGPGTIQYIYGNEDEFEFTLFGGDTLNVYDIDLTMFKPVS